MRRRALLSSLAATTTAALAGCASSTGEDATTTRPTDDDGTTDAGTTTDDEVPSGEPAGYASVVDLETGPRTYAFAPTGMHTDDGAHVSLWFDRTGTADHPPRLRGWLENANDYANTFEVEWIPVVGRTHTRQPRCFDHGARLHAAPTANNDLAETVPEVVRDESGFWRVVDVGPWMPARRRLDPGERVRLEYVLVGEPEMDGRPTGTYEFRGRDETARVAVWNADEPGPTRESRFSGRSVPAPSEDASVQWFHDAAADTAVYLAPSRERVELDGAVQFEVVNHGREAAQCGHWNVHKLVAGEWFHVAPRAHLSDCRVLHPGARMDWTLRAFNGEAVPCGSGCGGAGCRGGLTQGFLGGGEYAVVAGYGHPEDESAALVELVGDPVEVVPTEDASVEVDGSTATVTTPRWGDGEHPPDATLVVSRAESADERLLPEQVMAASAGGFAGGGGALRNALAAFEDGVERVEVRADEYAVDGAVGHDADVGRFELRGRAYEAARFGGDA
ncbi:hypothetical protein [Halobacterium yunchengense]|uniref:hypothetical protein n=1 Tax=Halobacterium yunchengense TaxID=3108497 RepID=UPI00300B582B